MHRLFVGRKNHDKKLLEAFDFDAFQNELGEDYFLMVRLHPQIQSAKVPETVANMTDYPNVRKLLCMTDILIADYSLDCSRIFSFKPSDHPLCI